MAAPTVRTLDQLMAENAAAYNPQRQALRDQINSSSARLGEQEQGLNAAQTNAFGQINQAASNKGMFFSGFTPDQQAKYTAEKYLPALANLRAANEGTIGKLNEGIMGLDSEQRKAAMQTQEGDLQRLYDYNKEQERRAWEAEQARIAYEREMQKMRESAKLSASRGGGGGGGAVPANFAKSRGETQSFLDKYKGRDGYVSPKTYADARRAWTSKGQDPTLFDDMFAGWANPSHYKDYGLGR